MRHLSLCLVLTLAVACEEKEPVDSAVTDADGDGYSVDEDCDDGDAAVNPGASESCDGLDNNCDGEVDEGVTITVYWDGDADGFGLPSESTEACEVG